MPLPQVLDLGDEVCLNFLSDGHPERPEACAGFGHVDSSPSFEALSLSLSLRSVECLIGTLDQYVVEVLIVSENAWLHD